MTEREVAVVKVQQDTKKGVFRVAVPLREVARVLGLQRGQRLRVIVDRGRSRIIYEVIE